jgi:hypothetical protein
VRVGGATRIAVLVAAVVSATAAPAARADHGDENLPWPQALPPLPVSTKVQPHGVPHCRRASIRCMTGLEKRLRRLWRRYDRACDHRALFAIAYLRITQGLRRDLQRKHPRWFRDRRWFTFVIAAFSNRYFAWSSAYDRGRAVPIAWRITFDEARRGNANGGQDVLLASNAHTQRDLPHVYAAMGLRARDGHSHKHDHDGVNAVNTRVFDGLEDYYASHYDPFFNWIDMKPLPLDELGTQEMVKGWREGAWRNAERLLNARTRADRRRVSAQIELNAKIWAEMIRSGEMPGYRGVRDRFCRTHEAPATPFGA